MVIFGVVLYVYFPLHESAVDTAARDVSVVTSDIGSDVAGYEVVADNFVIPWDIAFLPDGGLLVTERGGALIRVRENGVRHRIMFDDTYHVGEGGLLGVALHPLFKENGFVYLYSTQHSSGGTVNRVERFVFRDANSSTPEITDRTVIIDAIPGAVYHDGGRIAFGPDGYLYITTGDATDPDLAQDKTSLAGKILRVTDDGGIPPDNPFGTAVYSLGHRNPQGIAWDERGALWSTEHGRSGVRSGLDEINKIERGGNYGWPLLQGDDKRDGFVAPALHSGQNTWAPASAVFVGSTLFFGGLRGETLYAYEPDTGILRSFYTSAFGRIRTVRYRSQENALYITTSNRDGRGTPHLGDDKIIRILVEDLRM